MIAMKNPNLIVASLCAVGLVTGIAARRLTSPPPLPGTAEVSHKNRPRAGNPRHSATPAAPDLASFPARHSTETAESLSHIPDDRLYAPLALWLADASEPDIAAFWQSYSQKKGRSNDITDLIFLNWTRLDPKAAIAGSGSDQHAWWAWACHDPDAALAEAQANAPGHINHVAWGIGEFHPDWLRAHYNELSQGAKDNAISGMQKWDDLQDPLASIRFYQEIGRPISPGTFKALIRQDPLAALDWVKENSATRQTFGYSIEDPMKMIVDTMAQDRPDDLERLAAQTPSGQLKLQMESALFNSLLLSDPTAALEKARETTVPRSAAERYAAVGNSLVRTDPEQAFAIAKDLFTACPQALSMHQMVEYPGGASGSSNPIPGVQEFLQTLITKDPERALKMTMDMTPDQEKPTPYGNNAFGELAGQWANLDLPAFADWVNRQSDTHIRERGSAQVIQSLCNQENYPEAATWAMASSGESSRWQLANVLANWSSNDPQAATDWLDSADLPAERKKELRAHLPKSY